MNEFQQSLPISDVLSKELDLQQKAVIEQINAGIDENGASNYYDMCWTKCDTEVRGQIYQLVQAVYPNNEFARQLTVNTAPYSLAMGMVAGYEYGRMVTARRGESIESYNDQIRSSMLAVRLASSGDTQLLRTRICGEGTANVINDNSVTDNFDFWIGFRYSRYIADSVLLANVFGNAQLYDGRAQSKMRRLAKKILKMDDRFIIKKLQKR